jgi:hypothetical protein
LEIVVRILIRPMLVALLMIGSVAVGRWSIAHEYEADMAAPAKALRVEWRGQDRFLLRDGRWHLWGLDSAWVVLPEGGTPDRPFPHIGR